MSELLQDDVLDLSVVTPARPGEFPPIPEGDYMTRVKEARYEVSKSGRPMYVLILEIQDGEYRGRRLWHRRAVFEKTARFVAGDMEALRIPIPKQRASGSDVARYVAREAEGRAVIARVGFGTGENADRNEVKYLIQPDAEPPLPEFVIDEDDEI